MHPAFILLGCYLLASGVMSQTSSDSAHAERIKKLEQLTSLLTRQLMTQQLYTEEMSRSGGDSGIKQIRLRTDGVKPYFSATHVSHSVASIHDHSEYRDTAGMGETVVVLNGVEFRTRHNDYRLVRPSTTSGQYHKTEDIPYPDVPPAVLQKTSVDDQIAEMREWFKAWRDGDHSVRDYRRHFKPVLCYLEGAWTSDVDINEPFDSERHQLEADSWYELQEQIRFTSYTGEKSRKENFAFLPTSILNVTDGEPVLGQWNYRILCHPIKRDLDLSVLQPVEYLSRRLAGRDSFEDYVKSRAARFVLHPPNSDKPFRWSLLDDLMYEVPGKDNYGANITDPSKAKVSGNGNNANDGEDEPLNTGYYHRWYKMLKKDANGNQVVHRGFADRNLFVAETTQPRVVAQSVRDCPDWRSRRLGQCDRLERRVSYAIPLEIIVMTPLIKWNPYGLQDKGHFKTALGKTVWARGQRNGLPTQEKAFNGTNSKTHYRTPDEFFTGREVNRGTADTTRYAVGVLDRAGRVRKVRASGIRIFLPSIPGVGVLRTRFPIMPVHSEGDPVWKEVEALRDVVLDLGQHVTYLQSAMQLSGTQLNVSAAGGVTATKIFSGQQGGGAGGFSGIQEDTILETSPSVPGSSSGRHIHTLELSPLDVQSLTKGGKVLTLETSMDNGHSHTVRVRYVPLRRQFRIVRCDRRARCFDGHAPVLVKVNKRYVRR